MNQLTSVNPESGEIIAAYEEQSVQDTEDQLKRLSTLQKEWFRRSMNERSLALRRLANHLEVNRGALAALIAREMGKLSEEAVAEVRKCEEAATYYSQSLERVLAPQKETAFSHPHSIEYYPLGVVLAIMPWNFPFWQAFRAIIPLVAGGNTVLLKHASNVTGCSLALTKAIEASTGFRLVEPCLLKGPSVLSLIDHPTIAAVTFTGSTETGKAIAVRAAHSLKKTVLELGGSDPYFVCEDADLDLASSACAQSRLLNAGQSCISAKRLYVSEKVLDSFLVKVCEKIAAAPIAPLALREAVAGIEKQAQRLLASGARLALHTEKKNGPGFHCGKWVFVHPNLENPLAREETFGPLAQVFPFDSEQEALVECAKSPFALGAAFFSKDVDRMRGHASKMEGGIFFINDYVKSDPRLPFGGAKESGWGRELGAYGLWEFAPPRTIVWRP
jgi:succinate-semialdehyde dehydrogenase / glutarate-semialdehyde dehydrogenase